MRSKTVQSAFLSGVLDPRASGRVDTEAYNSGLLTGTNVLVHHLGGVIRRPGLKFIQQLPNVLTLQIPTAVTTPEGGTGANAHDDDDATLLITTGNIGTVDPYIVVRYDLGSAKTISHADVKKFKSTGSTSAEFFIQSSTDDAVWTNFGTALPKIDTIERTYRRTPLTAGGALDTVTAQYWRVVKIGGTDMSTNTVSLSEFNVWVDSGTVSAVRLFSFELTTAIRYLVAVTDRSATMFLNGAIPADGTFPLPYKSADIAELDGAVGADALFFAHEDFPIRFTAEEFTNADFQTGELVYDSVPQFDYDDSSSPTPTSEVQVITFNANWIQGDTFQIELDGARTGLVTFAGDATADERTTTASNIAREVQKLFSVPGFTGVSCSRTGALAYTVTFANASAKTYDGLMSVTPGTVVTVTAAATSTRTTPGVPRSEDVWSSTRGFQRTLSFFGGRLYFGGTRSKLASLFGSAVNDINSYKLLEQFDADPIFQTLDGQQLNAINALFSGQTLEIFTSGEEFRYIRPQGDAITPSDTPAPQSQYGSKRIRPVNVDDRTIFVQRLGKSIRDFRFDFEKEAYSSLGLSSLAPNLLNGVVDLASWQGSSTDEINLAFVINTDGTVAVLNSRQEANVRAWTNWTTPGTFKAVATTVEEIYFAVERTVGGTAKLFLEQTDTAMYVDSGVNVVGGVADNVEHLTGETVRVRLQTEHKVLTDKTGGTVTPSETEFASSAIQVGLDFDPIVTPMPLASLTPAGSNFMDKRRVVKARVKVRNTLGLRINGRTLPDKFFDIDDFDTTKTPFTGNIPLEETSNWDERTDKTVTFDQIDPLPMEILAIVVDLESR